MNALPKAAFHDRLPDQVEIKNAEEIRQLLAAVMVEGEPTHLSLATRDGKSTPITLVPALAESLLEVLRLISTGAGFHMIPMESEMTTQEAADFLNVSRPYLIKLLENGDIPFTKTGRHRRIKAQDILDYQTKRDAERTEALAAMAAYDAREGLL